MLMFVSRQRRVTRGHADVFAPNLPALVLAFGVVLAAHRRINDAIRRHDSPGAYVAMMDHVLDVERLSLEAIAEFETQ